MDCRNLPAFCINLKSNSARKEAFDVERKKLQLSNFKYFEAIDGSDEGLVSKLIELKNITFEENSLSWKEKACFLSHLSVWEEIAKSKASAGLVFEDDATFVENIEHVLDHLPLPTEGPYVVFLGYFDLTTSSLKPVNDVSLRLCSGVCPLHAYIISTSAASLLMEEMKKKPLFLAIDAFIFTRDAIPQYQTSCSVAFQNYSHTSDIQPSKYSEFLYSIFTDYGGYPL